MAKKKIIKIIYVKLETQLLLVFIFLTALYKKILKQKFMTITKVDHNLATRSGQYLYGAVTLDGAGHRCTSDAARRYNRNYQQNS